jgi:putative hydrolase of the HAD superfamily
MPVTTIFFDIGGVLLTDGWGHTSRRAAAEQFGLDWEEYAERHEKVAHAIETNRLSLDEYLRRTIFYRPRSFSRDEFRKYIFAQSHPHLETIEIARHLAASQKYFMGTINNESRELNNFRIEKFGLRKIFGLFVSSCYVGLRKPERDIYRLALEITQFPADKCCFIDDRALNLECAAQLGMHTIQMQSLDQLKTDLKKLDVNP